MQIENFAEIEEEFIQRAREMVKTNKLIKKECDPPTMKQLLKTI